MTRDEITRMAREAGYPDWMIGLYTEEAWKMTERFAALVAASEREACAKVCEEGLPYGMSQTIGPAICAAAIRARETK